MEYKSKDFQSVYSKYSKQPEYHYLARASLRRVLQVNRDGSRKSVAKLYVGFGILKSTNYKNLHMKNEYAYQINIINQIIWEARYRGLMREYDKAKVPEALNELNSKTLKESRLSSRQRRGC